MGTSNDHSVGALGGDLVFERQVAAVDAVASLERGRRRWNDCCYKHVETVEAH